MENKKSFLSHFTIIGGGTLINMFIGFVTTPIITRLVGTEQYGQYSVFTLYSSIALMVLCLGLDQALLRFFYQSKSDDYRKKLLFECWKLPIIASLLLGFLLIFFSMTKLVAFEFDSFVICMLVVNVFFQIIHRMDMVLLRVSYRTKLYSMLHVSFKLLFAILALVGCVFVKLNHFYVLVTATTLSHIVVVFVGISKQKTLWKFWDIAKGTEIDINELYRYALPFTVTMGITTIFQGIDKLSLNYYCSYSEVGIYSSAMTLVHLFAIVQSTFNSMWSPMAVEHYEKNPDDKAFYLQGNRIITVIMFFIGASLILVKDLFSLLLGPDYHEAAYILPFLVFNPIMYTISETTVIGLTFKKKSNFQILVAAISALANFIGNTILVPIYGGKGAAISTGIAYIVFFLMRTSLSNRFFHVNWRLGGFWLITGIMIVYAWHNTFNSFGVISCVGYLLICLLLIVFYRNELNTILHSIQIFLERKNK